MKRLELMTKYEAYRRQGHLVLAVTLSTFIKSATYAHSDRTRQLWDHHFIRRVERRLPERARDKSKIDHPDGKTMHVRFDDTHGHVQEKDGHKVE